MTDSTGAVSVPVVVGEVSPEAAMERYECLKTVFVLITLSLCCVLGSASVRADSSFITLNATANAHSGGTPGNAVVIGQNSALPLLLSPTVASDSFSELGASASASASMSGSVNYGEIVGSVAATASENVALEPAGLNVTDTFASGVFDGQWHDVLTVTSGTLDAGTPVDLAFTLFTNAVLGCSGANSSVEAASTFQAGLSQISALSSTCNSTISGSQQMLVATSVGSQIDLFGSLQIQATSFGANFGGSSSSVDPPFAVFYIDSETAGASYTTASGTSYETPASSTTVPEPETLDMLMVSLVIVGAAARLKNTTTSSLNSRNYRITRITLLRTY
jgi:hypothetical protein